MKLPDCPSQPDTCAESPRAHSLLIVLDEIRTSSPEHFGCLSGWQWEILRAKILRSGFDLDRVNILALSDAALSARASVTLPMGEKALRAFTDKRGIDKWVLSPLTGNDGRKVIPSYGFDRLTKQFELGLYLDLCLRRAYEEAVTDTYTRAPERFLLNPGFETTLEVLRRIREEPEIAVDVETGYGQINTVGFAWSESDAIAINVLPDRFGDRTYFELWRAISDVLRSPGRKIFQNFIYDVSYFSAYGIAVEGEIFDTMWAMKVLWPELKSNLGNVGRIYTRRPYWKDDGKVTDEEGKKKDWGNVRDWPRHYLYNCRDTTGTLEASRGQRADLVSRNLGDFFNYVTRLAEPIREMCAVGMPLDLTVREKLKSETEAKIANLTKAFQEKAGEVNPRSPKQVLSWLKSHKIDLPKKFDKEKGAYRDSTDSASLKKIRLKHPDVPGLSELQALKSLDKAFSSYIDFTVRQDGRLSYSLNGCGTETLRFSGGKDPWDRGFNIQTIPREGGVVSVKSMFVAPEGYSIIEADLKAAETWYVAYASVCPKLIEMLHAGADIHKHVALAILRALGKPESDYAKKWRDLGKKTGHGSNYMMKEGTFVENVFKDMDMILSKKEGAAMLEAYFTEFPEIRQWHSWIRRELYQKRKLVAPTGWERYFYGRPGDEMAREAVAWAPQHTVPWVINHMMFYLIEERKRGNLEFQLITQVHDALYLLVKDDWVERVGRACSRIEEWHPRLVLPGGELKIPVELEVAKCLANKEVLKL